MSSFVPVETSLRCVLRGTPGEDLRAWSDALVALDVVPTRSLDGTLRGWAFRTHPSTAARIERLQRLAAEMERE